MAANDSVIGYWLLATSTSVSREELIHLAKMAEQTERYDEMASAMKSLAEKGHELGIEDRNLLSVAYKNVVGMRRSSWRLISSIEVTMPDENDRKRMIIKKYRQQIENELQNICSEVQNLLDDHLLKNTRIDESIVFYYKMKGDYYRYLAEAAIGNDRNGIVENSEQAYKIATKTAEEKLPPTHPVRLGLVLNYCVFLYEIKNETNYSTDLAKAAYEGAVIELGKLQSDEAFKDSTVLLQLLWNNYILWSTDHCAEEVNKQFYTQDTALNARIDK